jgi:hypothetical protein
VFSLDKYEHVRTIGGLSHWVRGLAVNADESLVYSVSHKDVNACE